MWSEIIAHPDYGPATSIHSISDLIDACIDEMLGRSIESTTSFRNSVAVAFARADLERVAMLQLAQTLTPRPVLYNDVLAAFTASGVHDTAEVDNRYKRLLSSRLIEAPSLPDTPKDQLYVRVALDPVAEHLFAQHYIDTLGQKEDGWAALLARAADDGQPDGFLKSLLTCLDRRKNAGKVPAGIAPAIASLLPLSNTNSRGTFAVASSNI